MRAARLTSPKRFEFVDVPMPSPKPGEALVRMERLSICGSDLRTYDRLLPEEQYPVDVGRPCHECLGVVVESRTDAFKAGQRVIVFPSTSGGLVEYIAEPAARLVAVPEWGDPTHWIMCQPVGTVMYACQRIGSVLGQRVLVLGQGAIGLSFTNLLNRLGASQVIVTDLLDYRLELARKLGATRAINAAREDVQQAVAEVTQGQGADIVVEACGRPETANQIAQTVRREGLAVLFGLAHDQDTFMLNYDSMTAQLPTILVVNSARSGHMPKAVAQCVDLVAQGRMDLTYMVSHRLGLKDVQKAYDLYSEKDEGIIKVVMEV
ncbi:MAG: zinc-binding dehydrogenase [Chloroflexi bacterium]|nr:zinc-binding dehydrogenase [Chloroflexota bacterium]